MSLLGPYPGATTDLARSEPMTDQNPAAAPPCAQPTGSVKEGAADFLCQRGKGHPGVHEVMLGAGGSRLTWGSTADMDADREATES